MSTIDKLHEANLREYVRASSEQTARELKRLADKLADTVAELRHQRDVALIELRRAQKAIAAGDTSRGLDALNEAERGLVGVRR